MSKLAKFFIICGGVFAFGLVLTIVGFATGGIKGMDDVAKDHSWFEGTAGPVTIEEWHADSIKNIDIDGYMDVYIAGPEYYNEMKKDINKKIDTTCGEAGDICIVYGENIDKPKIEDGGDGNIKILTESQDNAVVNVNLSKEDPVPKVYIFASKDTVDQLNIKTDNNDVEIKDLTFNQANIKANYGEVDLEYVRSKGLNIQCENGDVDLDGEYSGETIINANYGDVDFETALDGPTYKTKLNAKYGEIEIGDGDIEIDGEPYTYEKEGGPNKLEINAESGDISVWFGDTLF